MIDSREYKVFEIFCLFQEAILAYIYICIPSSRNSPVFIYIYSPCVLVDLLKRINSLQDLLPLSGSKIHLYIYMHPLKSNFACIYIYTALKFKLIFSREWKIFKISWLFQEAKFAYLHICTPFSRNLPVYIYIQPLSLSWFVQENKPSSRSLASLRKRNSPIYIHVPP